MSDVLAAQAGLNHLDDVTAPPKGFLRLRAISAWTRSDARFSSDSTVALGAPFTAAAFGRAQFPPLLAIESMVQSATGAPFTLSLGHARLDATARTEIVPVALEYGITNRLAVGVTMPIVRKRVAGLFRLDTAGGFTANVGPNLHRTSTAAAQVNETVQVEFAFAALSLQSRLAACAANPSGPGCAALAGREAEAAALIQSSNAFASTVATLYGSAGNTGMAFVPTVQSAAQTEIALRVADFNTRYRDLLASSSDIVVEVPRAAAGIAGASEFQNFLHEELGLDSLASQERVGIGDVEIAAKFRVLDRPATDKRRWGLQFALVGGVRLPTGSRDSPSDVVDLKLGQGQLVVDLKAALDAQLGRFGLGAVGQVAGRQGDAIPLSNNRADAEALWTEIHIAPRWHLSNVLAFHGAYSYRMTDENGGDQLLGGGVSFLSVSSRRGANAPPMEMRFTHLEAIRGDEGRPKFFRDQLEVRVYFRLLGRK